MVQNVYSWDTIHRYFPRNKLKSIQQIINDWKSGLFKNEDGLKDKSKKPKNPFRKLEEGDVKLLIEKVQNEKERIKTSQSEFERDMIQDGGSLSENKLDKLKEKMNSAIHGVPRIAHEFNKRNEDYGKNYQYR